MTTKFKVLQVIPKLGFGGAETGCYDLAHYLSEVGCGSYIITSGGELIKYIKKKRVKVIKLPVHTKNPLLMLINTILISFIVIFLNIDIIHARSRAPAWTCYWSCFFTRKKFVTTFHGTYSFKNNIKKYYNSVMLKSKLTIAGSNFIFDHISKNYSNFINSKNKLLVIFRGINLEYFNRESVSTKKINDYMNLWKVEENKTTILLPGRITPWKGQEMFIEAINILKEDYNKINYQVIILGSDQGRNIFSKKIHSLVERYQLGNKIKFINYCKDMPVAYAISDIIVSSSIRPEAFGRVSVEAQAMKKPIVASNIGGSKETILNDKSGFLFKAGDPRELAKVLNNILEMDKETLNSIGNEGRKNVSKKFDVEKMCQRTFVEYQKLIK